MNGNKEEDTYLRLSELTFKISGGRIDLDQAYDEGYQILEQLNPATNCSNNVSNSIAVSTSSSSSAAVTSSASNAVSFSSTSSSAPRLNVTSHSQRPVRSRRNVRTSPYGDLSEFLVNMADHHAATVPSATRRRNRDFNPHLENLVVLLVNMSEAYSKRQNRRY